MRAVVATLACLFVLARPCASALDADQSPGHGQNKPPPASNVAGGDTPPVGSTKRSRLSRKARRRTCMVGVCVSGAIRSMASTAVQKTFLRAMEALGGGDCQVELLAHVSISNMPSIAFEPSPEQVNATIRALHATGKLVSVSYFDSDRHFAVPNTCETGLPPVSTYHQLYKVAACYHSCVLPRERELGRRYDWLVRARWDLGWITPPPPVTVLTKDRVHVPYNYWPLSDQFGIIPRHFAAGYFEAVRSFYRCISPMEQFEWFPKGVGESDMLLTKHLIENEIPYSFIEINAPIARASQHPESWCSGSLRTLLAPCLVLSGVGLIDWSVEYCQHAVSRLLECPCSLRYRNLNEDLGALGPRESPLERRSGCEDFPHPPIIRALEWADEKGEIMLILGAIGSAGGEHISGVNINSTESAMRILAETFVDTVASYGRLARALSVNASQPYDEERVHIQHMEHWDALLGSSKGLGSAMQEIFASSKYSIQLNEINPPGMPNGPTGMTIEDAALLSAQAQFTPTPTHAPWVADPASPPKSVA